MKAKSNKQMILTFLQKWRVKNPHILLQRYEENTLLGVIELTKNCIQMKITTTPAQFLWYIIQRPVVMQSYKGMIEDRNQNQKAIEAKGRRGIDSLEVCSEKFNSLNGKCRQCRDFGRCLTKSRKGGRNAFSEAIKNLRGKKEGSKCSR